MGFRPGAVRHTLVAILAAWALLCPPRPVGADVDPLVVIKRQIRKPNMLVVFDTSGSLTGVPGGSFSGKTEVGVDCDDGVNCRGGANGRCTVSGLACTNDDDCARARCELDGKGCSNDLDCAATGRCSITSKACRSTSECETNAGKCKESGNVCFTTASTCPTTGRCSQGSKRLCSNIGGACTYGTCSTESWKECNNDYDCPRKSDGSCKVGGAYCTGDWNCPDVAGTCQLGGSCTSDANCPTQSGTCSAGGKTCWNNVDCPGTCAGSGALCYSAGDCGEQGPCNAGTCNNVKYNWCNGEQDNWCEKYTTTCNIYAGNTCNTVDNSCTAQANSCTPGPSNRCVANTADRCGASPNGLKATYFENTDLTGKTMERIDGPIAFDYPSGVGPGPGISTTDFSAVWVGRVRARYSETYGFHTVSDDGVRLWVDGQQLINNWTSHASTEDSGWISLQGGKTYEIRLEYQEGAGGGKIELKWSSPSTPKEIIPKSNLYTATALMCRLGQNLCWDNSDCSAIPGDACGPPTSRAVIAKRAMSRLIAENYNVVNLGLMTFYQGGYFPYYALTTPTSGTEPIFFSRELLLVNQCWKEATGPTAKCTFGGATYDLRATNNSRYLVRDGMYKLRYERAWCGTVCNTPGGTGSFEGSFYTRTEQQPGSLAAAPTVRSTYDGRSVAGWPSLRYFSPRPDYHNAGTAPPISIASCGAGCGLTCGARWDTNLSDFINPNATPDAARLNAAKMLRWLEKASAGGLMTHGETPSGCTLENSGSGTRNTSAFHYMQSLKASDTLSCRPNFVLFVTDGEANGPGDTGCADAACAAANPVASGCACKAVLAAYRMRTDPTLNVRTFVVGFAGDAAAGAGKAINDNIARAGGTDAGNDGVSPFAFTATSEEELGAALQQAIYDAIKGSYSTTPATISAGVQEANSIGAGKYALDSRVDFPSWNGHLISYDITKNPPTMVWDAAERLKNQGWWKRRVYIGGKDRAAVMIKVDPSTKVVTNTSELVGVGLGATAADADRIARFVLGDPAMGNPITLGALVSSTAIDVGPPGDDKIRLGGHDFYARYKNRIPLVYVGADDGMLHAFLREDATIAGQLHPGGTEMFAYVPPDMVPVLLKLYSQKGQMADPAQHVFGLAASPKVKNVCISGCNQASTALWRTLLIMGEGRGGNGMFVLDVTEPVTPSGFSSPMFSVRWHSDDTALKPLLDPVLGMTYSVPGFFYRKTDAKDDQRAIMASGYRVDAGAAGQGTTLVVTSAATGARKESYPLLNSSVCGRSYTALTDVATARDFGIYEEGKILAAYVGDTFGALWRYTPGAADVGKVQLVSNLTCDAPLHFAPAVVQLDRDDPAIQPRQVYLVQVTNSALDDDTVNLPPSQMIIIKERADGAGVFTRDTSFASGGQLTLTVGTQICGVTDATGKCTTPMPLSARPTGTPTAILKKDGTGFLLISMWYVPDTAGCTKGQTYLALHEVIGQTVTQKQGVLIANEPVTSPVFAGGQIFVVSAEGAKNVGAKIPATFSLGAAMLTPASGGKRYVITNWTEVF